MEVTEDNSIPAAPMRSTSAPTEDVDPQQPVESVPSTTGTSKVTKIRSNAWLHFTKNETGDRAICSHCEASISCKTKLGTSTSTMLNHLKRCRGLTPEIKDEERDGKRIKQTTMHSHLRKGVDIINDPTYLSFDQEACRKAIVRFVIVDEQPFRPVEREGFRSMVHTLQPRMVIPSRRTLVRDILALYEKEKKQLEGFFKRFGNHVSLTTDLWTSRQNLSYMCLTAHFIDDDWGLQKKILNFCQVANHSGLVIGKTIEKCLLSWGIEKVFTVTVDNATSNDVGVRYLRERLKVWNGSILDGEFLHMRCGAHILNLIVKDGLAELSPSIERIRAAIVYIKGSAIRTQKFKSCMEQQKIHSNCAVILDVETRWNSTYTMLESALRLKSAFELMEIEDEKFKDELQKQGINVPTQEDWINVQSFLPFLKCFYETTVKISGSKYVTGNLYMKEIFRVAFNIHMMGRNADEAVSSMSARMQKKFFKYWGDIDNVNVLIYLATILDPRHKMKWVSWIIKCVYEKNDAHKLLEKIERTLERLFQYYETRSVVKETAGSSSPLTRGDGNNESNVNDLDALMLTMFEEHESSETKCVAKSELEKYLTDERESQYQNHFDILYWWKTTGSKYKVVSQMARDLLAMPVSTVASESVFSTGGRVIDAFRSSLTPNLVEALVCTQDWIRGENDVYGVEELMEELEKLETEFATKA